MARTWAQAETERKRLLALGRRLTVKVVKNPLRGSDGAVWPGGDGVNDYMLLIKDPRPTGAVIQVATQKNEAQAWTQQYSIILGRWHGGAAEHVTRFHCGIDGGSEIAQVTPWLGWKLYGAGETREGGQIENSAAVFA